MFLWLQVLWWDTRKLQEPTETLILDPTRKMSMDSAVGGYVIEYESTMVCRCYFFNLIQGSAALCNSRANFFGKISRGPHYLEQNL